MYMESGPPAEDLKPPEPVLVDVHNANTGTTESKELKRASFYSSTDTFLTATEGGSIAQLNTFDEELPEHEDEQEEDKRVSEIEEDDEEDDENDRTLTRDQQHRMKQNWEETAPMRNKLKPNLNSQNSVTFDDAPPVHIDDAPDNPRASQISTESSTASTVEEVTSSPKRPTSLPDIITDKAQTNNRQVPDEPTDDAEVNEPVLLPPGAKPLQAPENGYSPGIIPKQPKTDST